MPLGNSVIKYYCYQSIVQNHVDLSKSRICTKNAMKSGTVEYEFSNWITI